MTSKPLTDRVYITDAAGHVWGEYGSTIGACRAIADADDRDTTTWQDVRDTLNETGQFTATIGGQDLVFLLASRFEVEDVSENPGC